MGTTIKCWPLVLKSVIPRNKVRPKFEHESSIIVASTVYRDHNKMVQRLNQFLLCFIGPQLQFVMSQVNAANRNIRGCRWTSKDKALALSLLHSSPKTYRVLRRIFAMPSVRTQKKIMNNLAIYPGFNSAILSALKLKVQNLPHAGRLVCIAMDEKAIKEGLVYDGRRDVIEGVVDGTLANHALAFVVRGIIHRWKQPFGYFLASGPMSGERMGELLFEAIKLLEESGLEVTLGISDQGSNSINLFQIRLKTGVDKPFFVHQEKKVFVLYDPPHLIKNVRNNLKKNGFQVGDQDVGWNFIREFYDKDSQTPTRLAPQLTDRHLNLPPFSGLRVKLTTQVISHSVATGMKVMAQWGIIQKDAVHTADFLEMFDQLFNSF